MRLFHLKVVAIIEHVHEVSIEGMDVIEPSEIREDLRELLVIVHVRVLDLAHVELADAHNVVPRVHHSGSLPLTVREQKKKTNKDG